MSLLSKTLRFSLLLSLWLAALAPASADPFEEMATFSLLKQVDMAKLEKGEVIAMRDPPMAFERGLAAEACYIVPATLSRAVELHKNFNQANHPELNVYLYVNVRSRPTPQDFTQLKMAPNNEQVRSFAAATEKLQDKRPGLQLSATEGAVFGKLPKRPTPGILSPEVVAFWSDLLDRRMNDFLAGGLARQPPYADSIRASEEAATLLKEQARIQTRFAPLTALLNGGGSPALTWELFDAAGQAALSLGGTFWRQNGGSWQAMDVEYYASGGYYVYFSFIELWPIKVGAQPATLVWRGDFLSSATVGNLKGLERTIAGNLLVKGIRRNTLALLKDAAR